MSPKVIIMKLQTHKYIMVTIVAIVGTSLLPLYLDCESLLTAIRRTPSSMPSSRILVNSNNSYYLNTISQIHDNANVLERTGREGIGGTIHRYDMCEPAKNFIFVKTGKTGGSTVAATLYRYGLKNNLTAAVQYPTGSKLSVTKSEIHVERYLCSKTFKGHNFIANHINYYNYKTLNDLIPNARFVTILRFPYTQLESSFYYNNEHIKLDIASAINPFEVVLTRLDIKEYHDILVRKIQHGQLTKLGYYAAIKNNQPHFNPTELDGKLQELDKELDLVMITEYMDESFILLKKLMCWTTDDVVYHSFKVASRRRLPLTKNMTKVLSYWLAADMYLYEHYNRTLWHKINTYDGDFYGELRQFRDRQDYIGRKCAQDTEDDFCKLFTTDVPVLKRMAAAKQYKKYCGEDYDL
ncbi:galactose-3-O-sulfotransferase 2-like [Saccoglossus kowalevskii]